MPVSGLNFSVSEMHDRVNITKTTILFELFETDQANPDDATELSFAKGENLEVVERKGNWWQARKQDGTIGIVPSNYVSVLEYAFLFILSLRISFD